MVFDLWIYGLFRGRPHPPRRCLLVIIIFSWTVFFFCCLQNVRIDRRSLLYYAPGTGRDPTKSAKSLFQFKSKRIHFLSPLEFLKRRANFFSLSLSVSLSRAHVFVYNFIYHIYSWTRCGPARWVISIPSVAARFWNLNNVLSRLCCVSNTAESRFVLAATQLFCRFRAHLHRWRIWSIDKLWMVSAWICNYTKQRIMTFRVYDNNRIWTWDKQMKTSNSFFRKNGIECRKIESIDRVALINGFLKCSDIRGTGKKHVSR